MVKKMRAAPKTASRRAPARRCEYQIRLVVTSMTAPH
jgi:hypothetical protein